ncbi:MAG: hypothetical protein KF802_16545, partial [Bdellovibrionaceae bacterium]|nr:hypothetical protein [Pseudobdellovibrionaceae bacterium]
APASAGVVPSSPAATPPINRQALAAIMMDPWASDATKAAVMQQLMPKSPLIVKEGDTVLNPVNMQPLYKNEKNDNEWKEIRKDDYGNPVYGWVSPRSKNVAEQPVPRPANPAAANVQQQQAAASNPQQRNEITDPNDPNYPHIRLAPEGANTKEWYEAETKRVAAIRNNRPSQIRGAEMVTQDINRAINLIDKSPNATGALANITKQIGDSPAGNLHALLQGIKSNIAFDRLQAMRQNSPTGGALGSVSDNDMALLQSAYGSLEQSQDKDQIKYNLRRLSNVYNDIIHGQGNGPQRFTLDGGNSQDTQTPQAAPVRVNTIQDAMKLPKGTRFIDPNGIERVVP